MSFYILEAQRFNVNGHTIYPEWNGKFEHIGYMNKLFRTKKEASEYYNQFNPHMRLLNGHKNWINNYAYNMGLIKFAPLKRDV
jgi:hypothetical protein